MKGIVALIAGLSAGAVVLAPLAIGLPRELAVLLGVVAVLFGLVTFAALYLVEGMLLVLAERRRRSRRCTVCSAPRVDRGSVWLCIACDVVPSQPAAS